MKHSFDSYGLYKINRFSTYCIRTKVVMKEAVDIQALTKAVNVATRRYPYLMVKLSIDKEGGYDLVPNNNDIAVIKTSDCNPDFCTKEVGYHLLFADCEENTVYFNISHALAGGKGATPWVMSCVYQYVVEKYNVYPDSPAIRKPDSDLLEGEDSEPTLKMTNGSEGYPVEKFKGAKLLLADYLNSFFNPFISSNEYYEIEFKQNDIVDFMKKTGNSVLTLFQTLMFKTMTRVFPNAKKIVGESAHNPSVELGIANTYTNVLSHVLFPFTKEMKDWNIEKLGPVTRENLKLQIDPLYSRYETKRVIEHNNGIDTVSGFKNKIKYEKKHSITLGKDAVHGTYIVNYTGMLDWGETADYIEAIYYIVDGNQMLELSSLGNKIFCCFMQVIRTDKYISVFKQVLEENGLDYKIKGPFKKNLINHHIAVE